MYRLLLASIVLVSLPAASEVSADESLWFRNHLVGLLSCRSAPEPSAALTYLTREGYLLPSSGIQTDGETCWPLEKTLALDGLAITGVCASTDDPLLEHTFPEFFRESPGCCSPESISVTSEVTEATAAAWASDVVPSPGYRIEPLSGFDRISAGAKISCSTFDLDEVGTSQTSSSEELCPWYSDLELPFVSRDAAMLFNRNSQMAVIAYASGATEHCLVPLVPFDGEQARLTCGNTTEVADFHRVEFSGVTGLTFRGELFERHCPRDEPGHIE